MKFAHKDPSSALLFWKKSDDPDCISWHGICPFSTVEGNSR